MNKKPVGAKESSTALLSPATSSSYAQTMARSVDIHDAGNTLPELAEAVLAGQEVILSKAGKQVIRLVPIEPVRSDQVLTNRKLGFAADLLTDFSWEEWEASHEEFRKLFRDYQDFK
jgi:prevent-host-death family protein